VIVEIFSATANQKPLVNKDLCTRRKSENKFQNRQIFTWFIL